MIISPYPHSGTFFMAMEECIDATRAGPRLGRLQHGFRFYTPLAIQSPHVRFLGCF
jgi:hypothetical protein